MRSIDIRLENEQQPIKTRGYDMLGKRVVYCTFDCNNTSAANKDSLKIQKLPTLSTFLSSLCHATQS